jgi:hypothetical protein
MLDTLHWCLKTPATLSQQYVGQGVRYFIFCNSRVLQVHFRTKVVALWDAGALHGAQRNCVQRGPVPQHADPRTAEACGPGSATARATATLGLCEPAWAGGGLGAPAPVFFIIIIASAVLLRRCSSCCCGTAPGPGSGLAWLWSGPPGSLVIHLPCLPACLHVRTTIINACAGLIAAAGSKPAAAALARCRLAHYPSVPPSYQLLFCGLRAEALWASGLSLPYCQIGSSLARPGLALTLAVNQRSRLAACHKPLGRYPRCGPCTDQSLDWFAKVCIGY